jgi:anti-sigma factor RsiW
MSESIHPTNLDQFVAGTLSEDQNTAILMHLAVCDKCADDVEAMWEEHYLYSTTNSPPILEEKTAKRLEKSVLQRVHRSELGGELVRLSTRGALAVFTALLRPLVALISRR